MQATLDAARSPARPDDLCPACNCQLAVIRGPLLIEPPGPDGQPLPGARPMPEDSPRGRRQSYVGCGTCGRPVPLEHPRQRKLDAEWTALEAREKKEADRASKAPPALVPVLEANPLQYLEGQIDDLRRDLGKLADAVREQARQVAALAKAMAKAMAKK